MDNVLKFPTQIIIPRNSDPRFVEKAIEQSNNLLNKIKDENLTGDDYIDTMNKILRLKMRIKFYLEEVELLGRK